MSKSAQFPANLDSRVFLFARGAMHKNRDEPLLVYANHSCFCEPFAAFAEPLPAYDEPFASDANHCLLMMKLLTCEAGVSV